MNFNPITDLSKIQMTSFQGELECSYQQLVKTFGSPLKGDGYKTQAEWIVEFEDGTVATIYDWKMGDSYLGDGEGFPPEDILFWHIGGKSLNVTGLVHEAINREMEHGT